MVYTSSTGAAEVKQKPLYKIPCDRITVEDRGKDGIMICSVGAELINVILCWYRAH